MKFEIVKRLCLHFCRPQLPAGGVDVLPERTAHRNGEPALLEDFGKTAQPVCTALLILLFPNGIDRDQIDLSKHTEKPCGEFLGAGIAVVDAVDHGIFE